MSIMQNKTPRTCELCREPFYPVTMLEKKTSLCNKCLWEHNIPNRADVLPECPESIKNTVLQQARDEKLFIDSQCSIKQKGG